jgi:putative DNA primase/helicase
MKSNRYQSMADAAKQSATPEEFENVCASDVKIETIDWLWPNRFARGKLGLLAGMPERGKGLILSDIFARISRGMPFPCNEGKAEIGDVLLLQQEDDPADTVVPRLIAAGADLTRIRILNMIKKVDGSGKRTFNIAADLPMLRPILERANDPQLLAIDPITAYVGKINAAAGVEVRSALMPLIDLLREFHVAGIGVMHLNKKTDVDNAVARISDSLAFVAVSRQAFVVTDDPENERRLFVKAKNNLAPDVKALSYRVETRRAGQDHRDGRDIFAPCAVWGPEHVEISAMQAMQAETTGKAATNSRKDAKDLLVKLLDGGDMTQKNIEDQAEGECISPRTLRRAKKELEIESYKNGMDGGWMWRLPKKGNGSAEGF